MLQVSRITFRNSVTSEEVTKELSKEQESNEVHYKDKETGAELEVIEKLPLLEWLANNYKKFGCQLEFVTNKSQVQTLNPCTMVAQQAQPHYEPHLMCSSKTSALVICPLDTILRVLQVPYGRLGYQQFSKPILLNRTVATANSQ